MTEIATFPVEIRETSGGGASRALRRAGRVPGVLYGQDKENIFVSVDPRDVMKGMRRTGFFNTIFELDVHGKKERALVRDVQLHPVTDRPVHIDFWRVGKSTKLHIDVPVILLNEDKCPGIKLGGVLNFVSHTINIACSADHIPEQLTLDLGKLEIGQSLHAEALQLPKGVTLSHAGETIVTLVPPTVVKEAETKA